ncbi:MAG: PorT family protein [Bacteroidetes bacterium]|nr:PorT family protein [Bacteroidota bacterium]
MKKLFLASAMLLSSMAFSQIDFGSTRFGATAGMNYSRVRHAHNPSGPRYTFYAGISTLTPVDKNQMFFIQSGLEYYGAGETGKDSNAKNHPGYNAVYAEDYLSVPLMFKVYFSEGESEFFGIVGPRFNFLVNQKVSSPAKPYYAVDQLPEYPGVNGKANAFNFALGFGIGYSYMRKMEFTLKYDMGLSNTYPNLMKEPGNDPNIQNSKTTQVVSAGLSYIFD